MLECVQYLNLEGQYFGNSLAIDIDECAIGNCENGVCVDTDGSYNCTCNPGYEKLRCIGELEWRYPTQGPSMYQDR